VTVLGVLVALLLNSPSAGAIVRTLILLPWAIPPVVNGLMWQWIYDSIGALNGLLVSLGIISIPGLVVARRRPSSRSRSPMCGTCCRSRSFCCSPRCEDTGGT
jgi:hypothetical protein